MRRETKIDNGGPEMGHMKSWLMEHDECIGDAISSGAKSVQDIIAYCKTNMVMGDESYIREQYNEFMAGPDMTPDQIRYIVL
jgi:hypothetical protein